MVDESASEIADLNREDLIRLVGIFGGKMLVHYGIWFANTARDLSGDVAADAESEVLERYGPSALKRLAPHFGIQLEEDAPQILLNKSREELILLLQDMARTWLASDGIWFQALEGHFGMREAKTVNDACWSLFAPLEARKLRNFLGIDAGDSLKTLEKVLGFRLYSSINAHESYRESENSLVWKMLECRVQMTRRQKGLEDYPCKSAGIAEYSSFARGVDPAIKTECIICPPETAPTGEFCAWRFTTK